MGEYSVSKIDFSAIELNNCAYRSSADY